MRLALALLASTAALVAGIDPATACSPPPAGWMFDGIVPGDGYAVPVDGPIILKGSVDFIDDGVVPEELIHFVVTGPDGEDVPGTLAPALGRDDFAWTPLEPLTAGVFYQFHLDVADPWAPDGDPWFTDAGRLFADDAPVEIAEGGLDVLRVDLVEEEVRGDCLEDDFCGGCFDFETLGTRTVWLVEIDLDVAPTDYGPAWSMRTAVGVDEAEALAVLDRNRLFDTHSDFLFDMRVRGGHLDAWPADGACVAVEVVDPAFGQLMRAVKCFDLPVDGRPDERRPPEPVEPVDPVPHGDGGGEGGCDATANGDDPIGPGALLLAVGLLAARRRHLAGALFATLLAAGCAAEGDGDATCVDCVPPIEPIEQPLEVPPPVYGGALAATATVAVAGDPDRNRVYVVDLEAGRNRGTIVGGQPGRVVIDDAGERAYVTLRTDGEVLVVDLDRAIELARYPVCAAPRGIALDGGDLHVACNGGALVTLDATTGQVTRRLPLAPDLRDVMVVGDRVHVSRFRQPELITLDRDGTVLARRAPRTDDVLVDAQPGAPTVAWRTIALPTGDVAMLHQRARLDVVRIEQPGGYGGGFQRGCGGSIVTSEVTVFPGDDAPPTTLARLGDHTLLVDMTVGPDGLFLVSGARNIEGRGWRSGWLQVSFDDRATWGGCASLIRESDSQTPGTGQHTGITAAGGRVLVYQRDPAAVSFVGENGHIELHAGAVEHEGHRLFHARVGSGIACASCHPEGSDDGHAWLFEGHGLRRTQELRGGLAGTAPFHWTGDMTDLQHLMDEVMTRRMGGPDIEPEQTGALMAWLDAQPVDVVDPIVGGDPVAGEVLFADPMVGCASCHSGPRLSDDQPYDVGTGGTFVTPTLLGIGRRGSMMHDGCGLSLADRFDPACGGGEAHGRTAHLSAGQLEDLVAYLATL